MSPMVGRGHNKLSEILTRLAERSGESGRAVAPPGHVIAAGVVEACAVAGTVESVSCGGTGVLARRADPAVRTPTRTCHWVALGAGVRALARQRTARAVRAHTTTCTAPAYAIRAQF